MSYTKHTWTDGELVTAAKMNNIENGIEEASSGGGVLVVHDVDGTLDKTWQEIHDATANSVVILNTNGNICYLTGAYSPLPPMTTAYSVGFFDPSIVETLKYSTESASGYPTAAM